ncbi:SprT family protein [Aerococcus urinae]|uniref:SprT family protein n=1 Tax=Aerococcus urinae TaxID=1376 RepID=UPI00254E2E42|nr:SprT family protein [Aerococcus urinae]MDK6448947.1 SprT family protein [Aerococcus urinae]
MKERDLEHLVREIAAQNFAFSFQGQVTWNPRLHTTGGRFIPRQDRLEFNPKVLEILGKDTLIGIIKHELCHYYLFHRGQPYQHKDKAFKDLLKSVDGLRFTPALEDNVPRYIYRCKRCGQKYYRQRRMNIKKYACGKCRGPISLIDR